MSDEDECATALESSQQCGTCSDDEPGAAVRSGAAVAAVKSPLALRQRLVLHLCGRSNLTVRQHAVLSAAMWTLTVCLIIGLQVATESRRHQAQLARRHQPPARPFFPPHSAVLDLYDGNDASPAALLTRAEIVLVMYYAPWSLSCKEARHEFELAAKHSAYNNLLWAAVNCWTSSGECKQSYKLYTHPVLVAYVRTPSRHVAYHGHVKADFLLRFAYNLRHPLSVVHDVEEAASLPFAHAKGVLAYVTFDYVNDASDKLYGLLYAAALKIKERSPISSQRPFIGVTSNWTVARSVSLTGAGQLAHFSRDDLIAGRPAFGANATEPMPTTVDKIVECIVTRRVADKLEPVWLPNGVTQEEKDSQLLDYLTRAGGYFLLAFVPREPLLPHGSEPAALLWRAALAYNHCPHGAGDSGVYDQLVHEWVEGAEQQAAWLSEAQRACGNVVRQMKQLVRCCDTLPSVTYQRHYNICDVCLKEGSLHAYSSCSRPSAGAVLTKQLDESDGGDSVEYWSSSANAQCGTLQQGPTSPNRNLVEGCCTLHAEASHTADAKLRSSKCAALTVAKLSGYTMAMARNARQFWRTDVDFDALLGARCSTNRTLKLVTVDSHQYASLADKLDLPPVVRDRRSPHYSAWRHTRLAIVDKRNEEILVPSLGEFDASAKPEEVLVQFIRDFVQGKRQKRALMQMKRPWRADRSSGKTRRQIRLTTVTSANFESTLAAKKQDLLIFYTGGAQCLACVAMLHVLQTLAVIFADMRDVLDIVVVDVSTNELPWQYTVERTPALLFFPAYRRPESTQYPHDSLPMTVPNVLAWSLAVAGRPRLRWQAALAACDTRCLHRNRRIVTRRLWRVQHERRVDSALLRGAHSSSRRSLRARLLSSLRKKRVEHRILSRLNAIIVRALAYDAGDRRPAMVEDALFLDWLRRTNQL